MRGFLVIPVMALSLGIAACGDDDDDTSTDATAAATIPANLPDVVGDSVDDATTKLEDAGYTLRVLRRDGEDLAGTADYVETRVNVAVETQDDGTEVVTEIISLG